MLGPRLFTRTHLLALAALMLLPACSPRKPIPSDPPEVRTEAMVRGAARKAAQAETPQTTQPVAEAKQAEAAKPDVVVAHISDSEAKPATPAEAKAPEAKAPETKATDIKAEEAKSEAKPEASSSAKAEPAKDTAPQAPAKPEPSAAAQADATAQAAKAAADPAAPVVSKTPTVQIASFSTEKNADAALAWLKEKGYAEARVMRVEQGQAVYHRVQAGPFQDPAAARKALEELKADWPQAFIPAD